MENRKTRLKNIPALWEALLVFGALPPAMALWKPHGWIYLILWAAAAQSWHIMRKNYGYRLREDWNISALNKARIVKIIGRFIPCAAALFIFTWLAIPDHLFSLPRARPQVWATVMILYPLLSVVPQEMIFRSFFFRRYGRLPEKRLIAASALAFGWVHIVLLNWVAVVFSALGGLIFAHTYAKTRSLAAVCFEHALYGCYLFTLGLGFYFYHGQAVK